MNNVVKRCIGIDKYILMGTDHIYVIIMCVRRGVIGFDNGTSRRFRIPIRNRKDGYANIENYRQETRKKTFKINKILEII